MDLAEAGMKEREVKCRQYLKIIMNIRRLFFKETRNDILDKDCDETFAKMHPGRLERFKDGLAPTLKIA